MEPDRRSCMKLFCGSKNTEGHTICELQTKCGLSNVYLINFATVPVEISNVREYTFFVKGEVQFLLNF